MSDPRGTGFPWLAAVLLASCTADVWVDDTDARPPDDCPTGGVAAASCELADLQAAADAVAAAGGGAVCIPAGACVHAAPLKISDGVSLLGAGADRTVITDAEIDVEPRSPGGLDRPFRITGLALLGNSRLGLRACRRFRVDHLRIEATDGGTVIDVSESLSGVVDHCTVSGNGSLVGVAVSQGYDVLATDWLPDASALLGAPTAVVIEDSELTGLGHGILGVGHAHVVARHNTFSEGESADVVALGPGHGPPTGCRLLELHDNAFVSSRAAFAAVSLLSGSAIVTGNRFEGYDNGIGLHLDSQAQDYPPEMRPHGVWIWDDQFVDLGAGHPGSCPGDWRAGNASCNEVLVWDISVHPGLTSADEIQEGRDYWLRAPDPGTDGFAYAPLPYPHPYVTDGLPSD